MKNWCLNFVFNNWYVTDNTKICSFQVDEYVATIFPGNIMKKARILSRDGEGGVTFDGLEGGDVEYVVTGLSPFSSCHIVIG